MDDNNPQNTNLEVYRTYVEMTDRFSARRVQISITYFTFLSAIVVAMAYVFIERDAVVRSFISTRYILIALSSVGMLVSFCWWKSIWHYRNLGEIKYNVIRKMEKHMFSPLSQPYEMETVAEDSPAKGKSSKKSKQDKPPVVATALKENPSSENLTEKASSDQPASDNSTERIHLKKLTRYELALPIIVGISFSSLTVCLIIYYKCV